MDISTGADPPHDLPVLISDGLRSADRPTILTGMVTEAVFDLIWLTGVQRMAPATPCLRLVVLVEHPSPAFTIGGPTRNTCEFVPALVVVIVEAIWQRRPDHLRHGIGEDLEGSFRNRQPAFIKFGCGQMGHPR